MGIFRVDNGDIIVNNDKDKIVSDKIDTEEGPTVTLDGPLSTIYTKALKLVLNNEENNLANESTMSVNLAIGNRLEEEKEQNKKDIYVYCCNQDHLKEDKLINTVDRIRVAVESKLYNKIIVAIEHGDLVDSKLQLLDEFSGSMGAKVYMSRDIAIESIIVSLKGN